MTDGTSSTREHVRCPGCEGCLTCDVHAAGVSCNGTSNTHPASNVIMRTCGWCETIHPEHLSIPWFPDRLYFCADICYQEWAEQAKEA